ncbi:MAG: hypothetical protein ACHQTE_01185 [Candidatus Saccharimonadales bacterium]
MTEQITRQNVPDYFHPTADTTVDMPAKKCEEIVQDIEIMDDAVVGVALLKLRQECGPNGTIVSNLAEARHNRTQSLVQLTILQQELQRLQAEKTAVMYAITSATKSLQDLQIEHQQKSSELFQEGESEKRHTLRNELESISQAGDTCRQGKTEAEAQYGALDSQIAVYIDEITNCRARLADIDVNIAFNEQSPHDREALTKTLSNAVLAFLTAYNQLPPVASAPASYVAQNAKIIKSDATDWSPVVGTPQSTQPTRSVVYDIPPPPPMPEVKPSIGEAEATIIRHTLPNITGRGVYPINK